MRDQKGRGREGGVTSGRKSSPRSGTFLGTGGRERGGEWGREGRGADSPGSSERGSFTGSRPLAAAVRRSVRGNVHRRASERPAAPLGARRGGCAGTDLASRFLVSAAGRRSRGERLRTRRPSGASSRAGLAAPPPAALRPPHAQV